MEDFLQRIRTEEIVRGRDPVTVAVEVAGPLARAAVEHFELQRSATANTLAEFDVPEVPPRLAVSVEDTTQGRALLYLTVGPGA